MARGASSGKHLGEIKTETIQVGESLQLLSLLTSGVDSSDMQADSVDQGKMGTGGKLPMYGGIKGFPYWDWKKRMEQQLFSMGTPSTAAMVAQRINLIGACLVESSTAGIWFKEQQPICLARVEAIVTGERHEASKDAADPILHLLN